MAAIAKALVAQRAGLRGSPRRVGRWVVAVGLLAAGVMAPADSLPGPLDGLAPAPAAEAAAGTVVAGTPVDCSTIDPDPDDSSTTWIPEDGTDADDRECVLTADAVCPDGHVKPAAGDPPPWLCYPQSCSAAFDVNRLGNYRVPRPDVEVNNVDQCQVFKLTVCSAGIGPTHEGRCRYVQRRSWECPSDEYAQHNRFNTCYQSHTEVIGTPPPCDTATGAPDLPLLSCEDYAGDDYDNAEDCNTGISSHLSNRSGGDAAAYWCEFDAADLSVGCHRSPVPSGADCAQSTGVCLKRASTTRGQQLRALGGCRAIARNIECAIRQANYADSVGTAMNLETLARNIRANGCEPCRVMPFEPLNPDECPDAALSGEPTTVDLNIQSERINAGILGEQKQAFENKSSTREDCQELPPGRLTWTTPSFTGMAMVNTRVRLEVEWDAENITRTPGVASSQGGLPLCFMKSVFSQEDMLNKPRFYFAVEAEQLWPADDPDDAADTSDHDAIEKLFGPNSLSWWDDLNAAEQSERTAAFYATADTEPTEILCNIEAPVWCIWVPRQAGYWRLTATGALALDVNSGIRRNLQFRGTVSANWLEELSNDRLSNCQSNPSLADCQFTSGSHRIGSYIKNEPIGIQVHEVRVVSRTPSS